VLIPATFAIILTIDTGGIPHRNSIATSATTGIKLIEAIFAIIIIVANIPLLGIIATTLTFITASTRLTKHLIIKDDTIILIDNFVTIVTIGKSLRETILTIGFTLNKGRIVYFVTIDTSHLLMTVVTVTTFEAIESLPTFLTNVKMLTNVTDA